MTKKYIYILFIWILVLTFVLKYSESTKLVFNDTNYKFDNYIIKFKECELNTNNYNRVLSNIMNKDYKILEIIPYINESNKTIFNEKRFLFYSDNLDDSINSFKEKYTNIMIDNSMYISNICIKNLILYTNNEYLSNFNYNSTK